MFLINIIENQGNKCEIENKSDISSAIMNILKIDLKIDVKNEVIPKSN